MIHINDPWSWIRWSAWASSVEVTLKSSLPEIYERSRASRPRLGNGCGDLPRIAGWMGFERFCSEFMPFSLGCHQSHGWKMKWTIRIGDFPSKTFIHRGFSSQPCLMTREGKWTRTSYNYNHIDLPSGKQPHRYWTWSFHVISSEFSHWKRWIFPVRYVAGATRGSEPQSNWLHEALLRRCQVWLCGPSRSPVWWT